MAQLISAKPKRVAVSDPRSCERWLAVAPLIDPRQACSELTTLLEELEQAPPQPRHHIEILEKLRRPILLAAEENAKRFGGRPLPLPDSEAVSFDQVHDLLTTFNRAYRYLIHQATRDRSSVLARRLGTLCGRSLETAGELMHLHYECRREIAGETWQTLHETYQIAEAGGIALEPLTEILTRKITCTDFYARAVLMNLASPYALNTRELEWVRRWTRMWAAKVEFAMTPSELEYFSVNLAADAAPQRSRRDRTKPRIASPAMPDPLGAHSTLRYLKMSQLKRSVKKRLQRLEEGQDPDSLGLGPDCTAAEAVQLLDSLRTQWFDAPVSRRFTRRSAATRAELVSGFEPMLLAIGGKLVKNETHHWDFTRKNTEQVFIFGASETVSRDGDDRVMRTERWEMLEDSANGFRLRRHGSGVRLQLHQLIALRPHGAKAFILCQIRWLQVGLDAHSLTTGVQALPGLARPVSVRPTAMNSMSEEKFMPAFLLPATPASERSLVFAPGTFQHERLLDVSIDVEIRNVHLKTLIQRGYDFERATFLTTPLRSRDAGRII